MSNQTQQRITQEYYDEVCLENVEVFGLSEEEAISETEQQLSQSSSSVLLDHLSRTFPKSDQGVEERAQIKQFQEDLSCLGVLSNQSVWTEALQRIRGQVEGSRPALFLAVLEVDQGFPILVQSSISVLESDGNFDIFGDIIQTTRVCLEKATRNAPRKRDLLCAFHLASRAALNPWFGALLNLTVEPNVAEWDLDFVENLMALLWLSVKQFESNKKAFMNARITGTSTTEESSKLVVSLLDRILAYEGDDVSITLRLGRALCRLVTSLCTFEPDLLPRNENAPPLVSSAHAHVMAFHQEEFVFKLHLLLKKSFDPSMVLALRAMAINNEIVQAVVAVGLLKQAREILLSISSSGNDDNSNSQSQSDTIDTVVAVVGLFRNVCANDDVKTSLCIGNQSIVEALVLVMATFSKQALLQEHGCGTIAAMALRKPKNAQVLVIQYQAHLSIIQAMQNHPQRATLQRQGALAIRNLVSRAADLRPALLQADAGKVLLQIAAQHVSCQDEVYAALRDLDVNIGIVNVQQQDNGRVVVKKTEMFGEEGKTLNFRPVFD